MSILSKPKDLDKINEYKPKVQICPITKQIQRHLVIIEDGNIYEISFCKNITDVSELGNVCNLDLSNCYNIKKVYNSNCIIKN